MSVLSSKETTSKDIKTDKVGMEIQQKCIQQGVYYIEGKKEENKYECRKRRKQCRGHGSFVINERKKERKSFLKHLYIQNTKFNYYTQGRI